MNFKFSLSFSNVELIEYLKHSGDVNSIHQTQNPIIPGIMILNKILQNILEIPSFFNIKFIDPIYIQNEINVFQKYDNELVGFCNDSKVFEFKQILP